MERLTIGLSIKRNAVIGGQQSFIIRWEIPVSNILGETRRIIAQSLRVGFCETIAFDDV